MRRTPSFLALGLALAASVAVSQAPPAPQMDRIGFDSVKDYASRFYTLYVYDRPDTRQVRTIYGNAAAASVSMEKGLDYPYGSVVVMETHAARLGADNLPLLDQDGRFQKNPAAQPTLFVMKKDRGFGEEYKENRNGEWEYVAYRPDGTYQTRPEASAGCAICHLQAGATRDWTFRVLPLYLKGATGGVVDAVIRDYRYIPGVLRVKAGSTVRFVNDDLVEHTITDRVAGGGDSGLLGAGKSMSIRFTVPGEFNFRCRLHANMTGVVIVEP